MAQTGRSQTPSPCWTDATLRDPHAQADKAARVEAMFDAIAPTYERVNAIATLGRDAAWRRRTVAAAEVRGGEVVLDLCCGTGDLVRAFAHVVPAARRVIGVDFSAGMLAGNRADGEPTPTQLIRADALRLPLADESVDVISCAFGVRNFDELQAGLVEMFRVARPHARVVILEFAAPENSVLRWAYQLYCETVLPRVGAWISRDRGGAYKYLPRSIRTFESAATMARRLQDVGFRDVTLRRMNFGGVVLYRGVKPAVGART
jgi:demethylmenaquinone methyltransferase / 2-methoxy-6-polyprenyl-1,4-benzoquinol methylase